MPLMNCNNNLIVEFVFKIPANFSQREMKINTKWKIRTFKLRNCTGNRKYDAHMSWEIVKQVCNFYKLKFELSNYILQAAINGTISFKIIPVSVLLLLKIKSLP